MRSEAITRFKRSTRKRAPREAVIGFDRVAPHRPESKRCADFERTVDEVVGGGDEVDGHALLGEVTEREQGLERGYPAAGYEDVQGPSGRHTCSASPFFAARASVLCRSPTAADPLREVQAATGSFDGALAPPPPAT